jgi:ATP-binding cassette, subfamily C, bacterial exporter for protease/lipase
LFNFLKEKNELSDAINATRSSFRSVGAFSAVINLLALTPSIYMLQVYDRVLSSQNETTLVMLTIMTIGLFILMSMMESARTFVLVRVGNKIDMRLNQRIYNAAFEMNLKQGGGGGASQSLRDLTSLRQFITGNGALAFFDVPWIPIYLAVLYMLHPVLFGLAVIGALVSASLTYFNDKYTRGPMAEANKLALSSGGTADSNMRNAEVIEAMGMLGNLRRKWLADHLKFLQFQSVASDKAAVWMHASKYFRMFLQSAALGLGAYLVLEHQMTAGMMIAASILVGKALQPIDQLIGAWKGFASARLSYDRLVKLLDQFPAKSYGLELPAPEPKVSLESVSCTPPNAKEPTLKNATFNIAPATVVGIIGPSGAGKSTLARVLAGIWKPSEGHVRLDGAELSQWDRDRLGPFIGYLPQDIELFAGSVADNIARFGQLDSTKVIQAAQMAGVHELVLKLPNGYDTVLGTAGLGLSGGQRQRIALARALYGAPRLLILDEPNSNLDDVGEASLVQAIAHQKSLGNTVIVVTHRTNLLKVTDALILMKDGEIQSAGPTQQVLTQLSAKAPAVQQVPQQAAPVEKKGASA